MSRSFATVTFPWRCSQCRSFQWQTGVPRRYASTLRTNERVPQAQIQSNVSPTSPRYLPIPKSKQPTSEALPRVRGILPPPRDIFHRKRGRSGTRYTDEYFARLTKSPLKPRPLLALGEESTDPQAGRVAWRERMSVMRRKNLIEGVRDLQSKRQAAEESQRRIVMARLELRQKLRAEREARQDERLTASTVPAALANPLRRAQLVDPDRAERITAMKARVAEKESMKKAERRDALHTLYMQARSFITTESQLDAAIETAFGTPQQPMTWGNDGVSVWSKGNPESVSDKLAKATRNQESFRENQGFADLTNKRMKRIAEALTGGKM